MGLTSQAVRFINYSIKVLQGELSNIKVFITQSRVIYTYHNSEQSKLTSNHLFGLKFIEDACCFEKKEKSVVSLIVLQVLIHKIDVEL